MWHIYCVVKNEKKAVNICNSVDYRDNFTLGLYRKVIRVVLFYGAFGLGEKLIMTKHQPMFLGHDEVVKTIFVKDEGQATIVCPECGKAKNISATRFGNKKTNIKVRCSCTHRFTINLDFRRAYRKATNLEAYYYVDDRLHDEGWAMVKDISLTGICFETTNTHTMRIGQKGTIDFTLDNKKKSKLNKEFLIRSIDGKILRCQFMDKQAYEKDLGFYLIPGL